MFSWPDSCRYPEWVRVPLDLILSRSDVRSDDLGASLRHPALQAGHHWRIHWSTINPKLEVNPCTDDDDNFWRDPAPAMPRIVVSRRNSTRTWTGLNQAKDAVPFPTPGCVSHAATVISDDETGEEQGWDKVKAVDDDGSLTVLPASFLQQ